LGRFKNSEHIKYIQKFLEPEKLTWINFTESQYKHRILKSTFNEYKKVAQKAIKRMSNCAKVPLSPGGGEVKSDE
jgi:hypothetical protein